MVCSFEPSAWALVLGMAMLSACGPSIEDDGPAGTMSSSDSAQDAGLLPDPTAACNPLATCDEFDATIVGDCATSAFIWDGTRCREVTGCTCTGRDCCRLTATLDECVTEVASTCDDVAECLACAPGTQCVQYCDHVGTLLRTTCTTCDGGECTCGDVCTGICGGVCGSAHPDALTCVE